MRNSHGRLYTHLLLYHGPDIRFVCSGARQWRAIMSIHQCDMFRGRREAECLRRSVDLIRSSVGTLSRTRRLNVDKDFRLMLSGSGPCFSGKAVRSGALAVRRVGDIFYDRDVADVLLRQLWQTGSRMTLSLNRMRCDVQLRGCLLGYMLPENAKTIWLIADEQQKRHHIPR